MKPVRVPGRKLLTRSGYGPSAAEEEETMTGASALLVMDFQQGVVDRYPAAPALDGGTITVADGHDPQHHAVDCVGG